MSVLVDQPIWSFRGEKWSHLVSDSNYDELHRFANRIGVRRIAFQGDHYDIPQRLLDSALRAGAVQTESRELVRQLRAAGLRKPRGSPKWEPVAQVEEVTSPHDLSSVVTSLTERGGYGLALARQVDELWQDLNGPVHRVFALHRRGELAVAFDTDYRVEIASDGPAELWITNTTGYKAVDLLVGHTDSKEVGG